MLKHKCRMKMHMICYFVPVKEWPLRELGLKWWVCLIVQLLLGYLPPDRSLWSTELAKKRSQYKHFKDELLMNPVSHVEDFFIIFFPSYLSINVGSELLDTKMKW